MHINMQEKEIKAIDVEQSNLGCPKGGFPELGAIERGGLFEQ